MEEYLCARVVGSVASATLFRFRERFIYLFFLSKMTNPWKGATARFTPARREANALQMRMLYWFHFLSSAPLAVWLNPEVVLYLYKIKGLAIRLLHANDKGFWQPMKYFH